jgi:hypothetical protein
MVFSDGSHQFSFATKISLYIKQWIEVLLQSVILVVSSFILTVFFSILTHKKPSVLSFATIFLVVSSGIIVIANLIGLKWGPFRLQVRYLILFVLAFVFCKKLAQKEAVKKKAEGIFWLLLFPSVGMFVGILLASNVGPVTSASYLVLADIAFLLLYREMRQCEEMTEREEKMQQPKEESLKVGWKMVLYRESFLVAAILF